MNTKIIQITQEEFDSIYSDDISKKNYDIIIGKINDRFSFVMTTICPSLKKKGWFDYGNLSWERDGHAGHFDPEWYKEEIELGGEDFDLSAPYGGAEPTWIPTKWLWEDDFKEQFDSEVKKAALEEKLEKEKLKKKREEKKAKKSEMKKLISSKLTKEELKFVTFK